MDWLDLLAVQGTLKSLLQHHSSKAFILQHSAFFIVQFSHPYMTTGKPIALNRWTIVGRAMSLLFNLLSKFIIAFLPRSKCLLISWLQSPSAVVLEPRTKSFTVSPSICHEVMGADAMILSFLGGKKKREREKLNRKRKKSRKLQYPFNDFSLLSYASVSFQEKNLLYQLLNTY